MTDNRTIKKVMSDGSVEEFGNNSSGGGGGLSTLIDDTTAIEYKLGVNEGLLYIEEV